MHHASIRTANIHRAIAFYERLGFTVGERFTTGYTLACWLEGGEELDGRIELIEIPEPKPAPEAFHDEHYVGYYHLSFDLTDRVASLPDWLDEVRSRFGRSEKLEKLEKLERLENSEKLENSATLPNSGQNSGQNSEPSNHPEMTLSVLLEPQQQQIGSSLYEVAFIADADGLPLEFIRRLA